MILEGIHPLVETGVIPMDLLMPLIRQRPSHVEMIMTGPGAHEDLIHHAHLVTSDLSCPHFRLRTSRLPVGLSLPVRNWHLNAQYKR